MAKSFWSFNVFTFLILFYCRYVVLTTSMLNARRYKEEIKESLKCQEESDEGEDQEIPNHIRRQSVDWRILFEPIRLVRAMERYHNSSFIAFIGASMHNFIILLIGFKGIIFAIKEEMTEQELLYLREHYLSPLMSSIRPIRNISSFIAGLMTYIFLVRSVFFIRLVGRSIVNEKYYKKIWPSQYILGFLTTLDMTPWEYLSFIKDGIQHERELKTRPDIAKKHIECSVKPGSIVYKNTLRMRRMHQRYFVNLIDFESCMADVKNYFIDPRNCNRSMAKFHRALPMHLIDKADFYQVTITGFLGGLALSGAITILMVGVVLMEISWTGNLKSASAEGRNISLPYHYLPIHEALNFEHISNRWFSPPAFFSLIEDMLFISTLVSIYMDCALLYLSAIALASRAKKVRMMFDFESSLVKLLRIDKFNQTYHHPVDHKFERWKKLTDDANVRVSHYIHLVNLLLDELQDLRDEWNPILDLLVTSNLALLTMGLPIFTNIASEFYERVAVGAILSNSFIPYAFCLLAASIIEQRMRTITRPIVRLLVNEKGLFTFDTIQILLKVNERLNDRKQRSLLFLRHVALTPVTAVSALTWILSFGLLICRINSR